MVSLFISHSSIDDAAVSDVLRRLQGYGYRSVFLDIDPEHGIAAGRRWEAELHTQLERADALVFLSSPASAASLWCAAEIALARSLGKPVFPAQLVPGPQHPMLADLQATDLSSGDDAAYARLVAGLRRAGLDPTDSYAWDASRSPYPGLDAFAGRDAAVFFGRAEETAGLAATFQPTAGRDRGQFVAVVGPSGSGKSSLVRAGLLPRLARQSRWRVLPPLVPGEQPLTQLARTLSAGLGEVGERADAAAVEAQLRQDPDGLRHLAARLSHAADPEEPPWLVLFVDQAEEVVTRSNERDGAGFLPLLRHGLHLDSPLWVVATVRSDFLTEVVERADGAEVFDHTVLVGPLSRARLPEVIEAPARRTGVRFEPGLVARIVDDATGGDALPLLAYTLRQLYDSAGSDGVITHAEYDAAGGVDAALQRQADRVLADLSRRHPRAEVLATLLLLVSVQPGGGVVRRSVPGRDLTPAQREVVATMVDARLLRAAEVGTGTRSEHAPEHVIEVSHEALLRVWEPLRTAIEESRRALEVRSELEQTARSWVDSGREESYLPRGVFLDAARIQTGADISFSSGPVPEFLAAARHHAQRELRRSQRSNRRLRILAAAMALVVVLAGATAVYALGQQREASRQEAVAVAERAGATAQKLLALARADTDTAPATAIRLGIAANAIAPTVGSRAELIELASRSHIAGSLEYHSDAVAAIATHPRRPTVIATGGWDRRIAFWDLSRPATPVRLATIEPAPSFVYQLAFSPDGSRLAVAQGDGQVTLYDTADLTQPGLLDTFGGHVGTVFELAFSPDGRLLATAGDDKTVQLFDVANSQAVRRLARLTGHTDQVRTVAFDPDGKLLASGSLDRSVRFFDLTDPARPRLQHQLTKLTDSVGSVAFGPDGTTVTVGGTAGMLQVYGLRGARPPVLQASAPADAPLAGGVATLAYSPDGNQLAVGAGERLMVFNRYTDQLRHVFTAATGGYTMAVSYLDNGRRIATGAYFGKATVWNVTGTAEPAGHDKIAIDDQDPQEVAFLDADRDLATLSRDGRVMVWEPGSAGDKALFTGGPGHLGLAANQRRGLLAAGSAKTVAVWDTSERGRPVPLATVTGHSGKVLAVAISADGTRLVSGDDAGTVLVTDLTDPGRPAPVARLSDLGAVRAVAFSADGTRLAVGGDNRIVGVYDLSGTLSSTGEPVLRYSGLGQSLAIHSLAFSPDGRLLASGSGDGSIVVFGIADLDRARVLSVMRDHTDTVYGVAFSPDGLTMASISSDAAARLWDFTDAEHPAVVAELELLGWAGYGLAFNSTGDTLATAAEGANLWLWDLDARVAMQHDPVRASCAVVGRGLSEAEWQSYAPGIAYRDTCP